MSQTVETAPPPPAAEESVERKSLLTILIHRPEVGALVAALAIFVFFFAVAEPFRWWPHSRRCCMTARPSGSWPSVWRC